MNSARLREGAHSPGNGGKEIEEILELDSR